jgi:hypothetical protein
VPPLPILGLCVLALVGLALSVTHSNSTPTPTLAPELPTLPWLQTVHTRYAPQGLTVIAIHSPEFDLECDPASVAAHVRQLGIDYPVLIDNDFRHWQALGDRFWPAFYLIDAEGRIIATRIGELHSGERSADESERAIAALTRTRVTPYR